MDLSHSLSKMTSENFPVCQCETVSLPSKSILSKAYESQMSYTADQFNTVHVMKAVFLFSAHLLKIFQTFNHESITLWTHLICILFEPNLK